MIKNILKRVRARRQKRLVDRAKAYRDADFEALRKHVMAVQKKAKDEIAVIKTECDQLSERLRQSEHERERMVRELELARLEIESLAAIIERDRRRVEAETAIAAARIEAATAGLVRAEAEE